MLVSSGAQTLLSALRASHFLLLRQKKVSKEKVTPGCAVGFADSPALLETGEGCGTRATPSDSPRPLSAGFCVARRSTRGPKVKSKTSCASSHSPSFPRRRESRRWVDSRLRGNDETSGSTRLATDCYGRPEKKPKTTYPSSTTDTLPGPLSGAEQRRRAGGFWLALFEPQASLASHPARRVAQGTGQRPAPNQGSPFLWLLSFGEAKESTPARQAENSRQSKNQAN